MEGNAQTIIVEGTRFEGKVSGNSDVRIEGELSGEIDLECMVVVAASGRSEAEINAHTVLIEGEHSGNITAKEYIQISPNGKVKAELHAPTISIEKGAKFSGKIDMMDGGEEEVI